jgi:4-carboxymuconolactone decarboxylase
VYGVLSSSIRCRRGGGARSRRHGTGKLDPKMRALARLAAYVALDASAHAYLRAVEVSVRCGASPDEMVGVLFAVAPVVGVARVVSAAPKLASAMGFDVDRAIEYLTINATEVTGSP